MAKVSKTLIRKERKPKPSVTIANSTGVKIKNNPNENPRRAGRSGKRKRMVQ
jgi:hypothetical protein